MTTKIGFITKTDHRVALVLKVFRRTLALKAIHCIVFHCSFEIWNRSCSRFLKRIWLTSLWACWVYITAFISQLKGCPEDKVKPEVDDMIAVLRLVEKRKCEARRLSGGMKRKLCMGIALIAGSKVTAIQTCDTHTHSWKYRKYYCNKGIALTARIEVRVAVTLVTATLTSDTHTHTWKYRKQKDIKEMALIAGSKVTATLTSDTHTHTWRYRK